MIETKNNKSICEIVKWVLNLPLLKMYFFGLIFLKVFRSISYVFLGLFSKWWCFPATWREECMLKAIFLKKHLGLQNM